MQGTLVDYNTETSVPLTQNNLFSFGLQTETLKETKQILQSTSID